MAADTKPIEDARILSLNDLDIQDGGYLLYWMQRAQRAEHNDALEFAIRQANEQGLPLLVAFGLTDDYPEANLRHYAFMIEGLQDAQNALAERGVKMIVRRGEPADVILELAQQASAIICDRAYLRLPRAWRRTVATEARCRVWQVEADVVVPVELVSNKAEYAARTIRPKINRLRDDFLVERSPLEPAHKSVELEIEGLNLNDIDAVLDQLSLDVSVPSVSELHRGGTTVARHRLKQFIDGRLEKYDENRNQIQTDDVSYMGMYLHFGQISPVYLAMAVRDAGGPAEAIDSYLEELIVRRELAINFVYYTENYDQYGCLPDWAQKTLAEHRDDRRQPAYSPDQLEGSETHDPYWNAAMDEMYGTGYMHNYMRMYWGKKILEWSATPEQAYETALALNNKYFLDGRDPNSYAGVGWVFGLHDRAWAEREVYGKIRYMSAGGLERKAKPEAYVQKVEALKQKVARR